MLTLSLLLLLRSLLLRIFSKPQTETQRQPQVETAPLLVNLQLKNKMVRVLPVVPRPPLA